MGVAGFFVLKKMKKPPVLAEITEHALPVRVVRVEPQQAEVLVSGYGEIRCRTNLPLAAEAAGRVVSVHPQLQVGGVISKGEVLFMINDQDFKVEYEAALSRLKNLQREFALAQKEFDRQSRLYTGQHIGSQSSVEKAEQAVNSLAVQVSQVRQIRDIAALKLNRCTVKAPFTCRITSMQVEEGEYVMPGKELLQIVDDADLEITVPLDSREAVNWLRFKPSAQKLGWFGVPEQSECRISWTEKESINSTGHLDRVVRYDSATRTLDVAVRLDSQQEGKIPLVQGMFCRVDIPGKRLDSVFVVPRQAVSFEGTVHVVINNRLQTRQVEVVRTQEGSALISSGLEAGDLVITTRLENPLENTLLRITSGGESVQ